MTRSSVSGRAVRRALSALEGRILAMLLLYGLGRTAAAGSGLLLGLYALDRVFEPPAPVRVVLGLGALLVLTVLAARRLLLPLRRRPARRDLAAFWERAHPELDDLFLTAVELTEAGPGASPGLLAAVREQAEEAADHLDPRSAVPAGRARRSALSGLGALAGLVILAALAPREAGTFFSRMIGGGAAWPRDTLLVLLPPHAEGSADLAEPEPLGGERFTLSVARGTVLTLRVRAEGVVPERVVALGQAGQRAMRPLGGGEFVLRLPPLQERREFGFAGGDDADGLPHLSLIPGTAPAVADWTVAVAPPVYTGLAARSSPANEFRVPRGTRLTARFRADRPVTQASVLGARDEERSLTPGEDGFYSIEIQAEVSDELHVLLEGADGFRDTRAAVLRWWAEPDRAPQLEFLLPAERWTTVSGGAIPVLLSAEDDYGLAEVGFEVGPAAGAESLDLPADARRFRHFSVLNAPDQLETLPARFRLTSRARDRAEPAAQETRTASPWIEVVARESFEERLAERMARSREIVERLQDRTRDLLDDPQGASSRGVVRRIRRDLDGLQIDLERALLERLYAGVDRGTAPAREALDTTLAEGLPAAGGVVAALSVGGVAPPLDRSGLLLDLGRAAAVAREHHAPELARAVAEDKDPVPAARALQAQLDVLMRLLVAWEDFDSAVNLLRGLLDRQRTLYLRTRKAADS